MAKTENFPEKERIHWHPKYSQNCPRRPYKAGWKLPRVLPLELLATVRLRFTFASSQSKSKSPSRSPQAKTHECEMAPKKNKSKIEEKTVAEPPKLSQLKCAGHHHKGNISLNALQTEQFLVCRVTSRYNHRFSDRTSIPRTKASPEILQPQFLQHKHNKDYKLVQIIITKTT